MAAPNVEVVVEPDSLRRSSGGTITGHLWLRWADADGSSIDFPEAGWADFPVPVLSWWLQALGELRVGSGAAFRFMDGPHSIHIDLRGETLTLHGHEMTLEVMATAFESRLREAASRVLSECDQRGWSSRDILQLREVLARPVRFGAG